MQDDGVERSESAEQPDWNGIVESALAGDRVAYARLTRLVTGHLAHWRAYDFRADWDDIVQDVLVGVVRAHQEGRLDAPGALRAYLRQATRFRFIDRIRAGRRRAADVDPIEATDRSEAAWPPSGSLSSQASELSAGLRAALETLPERERLAVVEVHVLGRTYDEAAAATGIPLGSLKRSLRTGLARLRERLERV